MEILRGVQAMATWDADELDQLLRSIQADLPSSQLEWDLDAGEEWVRILNAGEVDALIRAPTSVSRSHRFAFVCTTSAAAELLRPLFVRDRVEVVELADFELPTISVQVDDLAAFIGASPPPAYAFDANHFSANDLWFVSV
jgi:hypothetical protein